MLEAGPCGPVWTLRQGLRGVLPGSQLSLLSIGIGELSGAALDDPEVVRGYISDQES